MSKVIKEQKSKTSTENFATKVVESIKSGKFVFNPPINVKSKDSDIVRYSTGSDLPSVELDIIQKDGVKNSRYVLNVRFKGAEVDGSIRHFAITGHYARLALKYITKKPSAPRKLVISNEDLELANQVFGF